jgi:hypothetical protein
MGGGARNETSRFGHKKAGAEDFSMCAITYHLQRIPYNVKVLSGTSQRLSGGLLEHEHFDKARTSQEVP